MKLIISCLISTFEVGTFTAARAIVILVDKARTAVFRKTTGFVAIVLRQGSPTELPSFWPMTTLDFSDVCASRIVDISLRHRRGTEDGVSAEWLLLVRALPLHNITCEYKYLSSTDGRRCVRSLLAPLRTTHVYLCWSSELDEFASFARPCDTMGAKGERLDRSRNVVRRSTSTETGAGHWP